jgi:predicted DNA-binding transcriptional regulator AlpA
MKKPVEVSRPPVSSPKPIVEVPPQLRTLDIRQMCEIFHCDRTTLWRRVGSREIPAPIKFGRRVIWRENSIISTLKRLEEEAQRSSV